MGIKFTAWGRLLMLKNFGGNLSAATLSVRLFTDNISPSSGNDDSTFTEPSYSGYTAASPEGTTSYADDGTSATWTGSPQFFGCTGAPGSPINVYGYWLRDESNGHTIGGERFSDAPRVVADIGDAVPVVPRINLGDQ